MGGYLIHDAVHKAIRPSNLLKFYFWTPSPGAFYFFISFIKVPTDSVSYKSSVNAFDLWADPQIAKLPEYTEFLNFSWNPLMCGGSTIHSCENSLQRISNFDYSDEAFKYHEEKSQRVD